MKLSSIHFLLFVAILSVLLLLSNASDPDPLQDFCIAVDDARAAVFLNGRICKDPSTVTTNDFYYSGHLNRPGNITSPLGSRVTRVFESQLPGLNTLGVAMARLDFLPNGLNPPHLHPRASEILTVLEGTLYAGFITSNPADANENNKLFATFLHAGDSFAFPRGLIHFQYNVGKTNAVAFVGFNSQNPGIVAVAKAAFGSEPPVFPEVLAKAFQVDEKLVEHLQSLAWIGNV